MVSLVGKHLGFRLGSPRLTSIAARLASAAVVAGLLVAMPLEAGAQSRPAVTQQLDVRAGEMQVPLHKSQVLRLDRPFTELSVGNPEIADVLALTDRSVYVLGKNLGSTNLSVYGRNKQLVAVVDLVVTHDIAGIKNKLFELMPNERIEVRAVGDAITLNGVVSSPEQAGRAVAIAQRYAPDKVTNLMRVRGSQQVMLAVRIAEISRSVSKELGIKPFLQLGNDDSVTIATLDPLEINRFGAALLNWTTGFMTLELLIDALEEKGVVKILAEPNLIALSGDTANFLAGGEFPIPVAQSTNQGVPTITVEFKQFGVSLAFTPTVLDGDLINLVVAPEVSQIDRTTAVTFAGFAIPGLSTRRATTTVEVRDGESFAIAGLLQNDFSDQIRQLPGIGDVPVLGALFRSSQFQRRETELVIIVTPRLVRPTAPGTLMAPTDTFVPPSDTDIFFWGRPESPTSGTPDARTVLGAQTGGGVVGPYGHIIK